MSDFTRGNAATWAREHGIDTRIPGFGHRPGRRRGFNAHGVEARHPANRPAFPTAGALAMKGISRHPDAPAPLSRSFASFAAQSLPRPAWGGRKPAQLSRTAWLRPPIRSVLPRRDIRLRAGRIGRFTRAFPATSPTHDRRLCGPSPRGRSPSRNSFAWRSATESPR